MFSLSDFYNELRPAFQKKYNVSKDANNDLVLELSLPGYSREDLEVYNSAGYLVIKTVDGYIDKIREYYYRGFSKEAFKYTLRVGQVVVTSCELENGVLRITLGETYKHEKAKNLLSSHSPPELEAG